MTVADSPRVRLDGVSFEYPLYEVAERSLKVTLMQQFSRGQHEKPVVRALSDVSFSLSDGDRLGLIGPNGAGKSSLLRILGGLAHPIAGKVEVTGRVATLIEKGLGINPELSAADNIELPLRLLGATTAEIDAAREEVRDFADLGAFFDLPLRRYSEGMKARLSFALSTAIPTDVLILDEWLSAGDAAFVQKAKTRLAGFLDRIKVVVLASHDLGLLRKACTHVAWLDKGRLVAFGAPDATIDRYLASALGAAADDQPDTQRLRRAP